MRPLIASGLAVSGRSAWRVTCGAGAGSGLARPAPPCGRASARGAGWGARDCCGGETPGRHVVAHHRVAGGAEAPRDGPTEEAQADDADGGHPAPRLSPLTRGAR